MSARPRAQAPFEVRPARRGEERAIAEVHVASWRETYRGLISDATLDRMSVNSRARIWREQLLIPRPGGSVTVATDAAGDIIGFGSAGPQREDDRVWDGEIYALYILRAAQRQGLGRRILTALARTLIEAGCASADVWALSTNTNAVDFYRAMGAEQEATRAIRYGAERLSETAFIWRDLKAAFG